METTAIPIPLTSGPSPTAADLASPEFQRVWDAIKGWDIERVPGEGAAGATGNDVMTILLALRQG